MVARKSRRRSPIELFSLLHIGDSGLPMLIICSLLTMSCSPRFHYCRGSSITTAECDAYRVTVLCAYSRSLFKVIEGSLYGRSRIRHTARFAHLHPTMLFLHVHRPEMRDPMYGDFYRRDSDSSAGRHEELYRYRVHAWTLVPITEGSEAREADGSDLHTTITPCGAR